MAAITKNHYYGGTIQDRDLQQKTKHHLVQL